MANSRKKSADKDANESWDELGSSADFAANNLNEMTNEIGSAGAFDRTDIHNPLESLEAKRHNIESEHEGLRGVWNWALGKTGIEPTYQDEMNDLSQAEQDYRRNDSRDDSIRRNEETKQQFQQLQQELKDRAKESTESQLQRNQDAIQKDYDAQMEQIAPFANQSPAVLGFGHDEGKLDSAIQQMRNNADTIRQSETNDLATQDFNQSYGLEGRRRALNFEAAGDTLNARRQALINSLNSEQASIDPHDQARLSEFKMVRDQSLANFDADAARQQKFQQSQSNDRVLGYQEEGHEAELRGEGHDDDAKISALKFASEQRVRNLQEEADAEADPTKKAQLLREAKAASDAGGIEQNALQKELARSAQMSNVQAPALAGASQQQPTGNSSSGRESSGNLAEVSRKLDDAAGKMEKAFANNKTVVILKD